MTVCALLVLFALTSLIPLHYGFHEPTFTNPIPSRAAQLRYDSGGKGHFGAPRNGNRLHNGVDLLAVVGDPVVATKSGRVIFSDSKGGYGLYVQVLHPDGHDTRYAHLSRIDVQKGSWVRKGQVVGLIGKTGNAQGRSILPHLHYEIRRNEAPVDPTPHVAGLSKQPIS